MSEEPIDPRYDSRVGAHLSGDDDEQELAEHGKGLVVKDSGESWEKPTWASQRLLCSNCKKGIHNTPNNDDRCKGRKANCECRCRTHYVGRDGHLYRYGQQDKPLPPDSLPVDETQDAFIAEIEKEWHDLHGTVPKPKIQDESKSL